VKIPPTVCLSVGASSILERSNVNGDSIFTPEEVICVTGGLARRHDGIMVVEWGSGMNALVNNGSHTKSAAVRRERKPITTCKGIHTDVNKVLALSSKGTSSNGGKEESNEGTTFSSS